MKQHIERLTARLESCFQATMRALVRSCALFPSVSRWPAPMQLLSARRTMMHAVRTPVPGPGARGSSGHEGADATSMRSDVISRMQGRIYGQGQHDTPEACAPCSQPKDEKAAPKPRPTHDAYVTNLMADAAVLKGLCPTHKCNHPVFNPTVRSPGKCPNAGEVSKDRNAARLRNQGLARALSVLL